MDKDNKCPLCKNDGVSKERWEIRDAFTIKCIRCGTFRISGSLLNTIDGYPQEVTDNLHLLSGWTRTRYDFFNEIVILDTNSIDSIIKGAPRDVGEKKNLLLKFIARKSEYPSYKFILIYREIYPVAFCRNSEELSFYMNDLHDSGAIDTEGIHTHYADNVSLTTNGWEEYDEIERAPIDSNQVFLAMKFDNDMDETYIKGFAPAIEGAGYDCYRIDKHHHNKKICEEIIYQIEQSKFLVADATG